MEKKEDEEEEAEQEGEEGRARSTRKGPINRKEENLPCFVEGVWGKHKR